MTILGYQHVYATFNFAGKFSGKVLSGQSSKPKPKTEYAKSVHACVEQVCKKTEPRKTFKSYTLQNSLKAQKSSFFDKDILPILLRKRESELARHEDVEKIIESLTEVNEDIPLDENERRLVSLLRMLGEGIVTGLPVKPKKLPIGPRNNTFDFSPLFSGELDEQKFLERKKSGTISGISLEFAKYYTQNRDLKSMFPMIGNSENALFSLINNQGNGAKRYLLTLYDRGLEEMARSKDAYPSYFYDKFTDFLLKYRSFTENNFEDLKKFSVLTEKSLGFLGGPMALVSINELQDALLHTGEGQLKEVPSVISKKEISRYKDYLSGVVEAGKEFLNDDAYRNAVSNSCKWKLNYVYESLPTKRELKTAERKVSKANVQFLNWLYASHSLETATSIFDFLKSWEFFYPPTKEEFKNFLQKYFALESHGNYLANAVLYGPAYALVYDLEGIDKARVDTSLKDLLYLCKAIDSNPISDRTFAQTGQVFLGWMSLKDSDLLRSVVWHELGHIVSSVIRQGHKWDVSKTLLNEQLELNISSDSFKKYVSTRQCLGRMQVQPADRQIFKEPYLTWYKQGALPSFDPNSSQSKAKGIQIEKTAISDSEREREKLGKFTVLSAEESEALPWGGGGELLLLIEGQYVEEDWSDWVSTQVLPKRDNHFCFFIKERDHLYWSESEPVVSGDNDHSNILFRLLNHEVQSTSGLPKECTPLINSKAPDWHLQRCE